ncbi:response regulator [Paractinoplanes durhamensis]|uniref:response regulator n=1 Tax=Paractinoplanes durhamensis TaxID=113563 RepID=UPI001944BD11|nr:response regulator [Actinoplanes durhamensis]
MDDDVDILELTAHALSTRGFAVRGVSSGTEAVDVVRREQGHVDLLVADLSLPGDTSRYTQTIAAEFPGVKIVYATGIPRHIALSTGLVPANAPYLQKPVDSDLMANVLRGELAKT